MKKLKPKPATTASKPIRDTNEVQQKIDDLHMQVAEAEESIAHLILQVQRARSIVIELLDARVEKAFSEVASFNRNLQHTLMREVQSFLKVAPIWDIVEVRETGCMHNYKTVKYYYDRGYTMLGYSYNPETSAIAGTLMHRPCLPKTEQEFLKLYACFVQGEKMLPTKPPIKSNLEVIIKPNLKPKNNKKSVN